MDQIIRKALWVTFVLYLSVSYVNTAGLASHFEPNFWVCNLWSLAIELGDVTLLLGTLKRKQEGKPYGGYLATFLVSLAVSVAANVFEWTNNFLGDNAIYVSLHQFEYSWVVPALLGVTIPALMLSTGSILSDFSHDSIPGSQLSTFKHGSELNNIKEETLNGIDMEIKTGEELTQSNEMNYKIEENGFSGNHSENKESLYKGEMNLEDTAPLFQSLPKNSNGPSPDSRELMTLTLKELATKYNVSERTVTRWKSKLSVPSLDDK